MIDARRSIIPDIALIASDIREADRREIESGIGGSARDALFHGYVYSDETYTVFEESSRKPLAMFGCGTDEPGLTGIVWLMATNGLKRHRWEFLRKSQGWVDHFQSRYPLLTNMVDSRNTLHIRWLRWTGFKFIRIIPEAGKHGIPFVEFARIRQS